MTIVHVILRLEKAVLCKLLGSFSGITGCRYHMILNLVEVLKSIWISGQVTAGGTGSQLFSEHKIKCCTTKERQK